MDRVGVQIDGGGVSGGIIGPWFFIAGRGRFSIQRLFVLDD